MTAKTLPCRSCGAPVRVKDAASADVIVRQEPLSMSRVVVLQGYAPTYDVPVSRCDDCNRRRDHAAALLAAHPRVARQHASVGLDRLDAALATVDLVLGPRGSRGGRILDHLTDSDAALREFIDTLAPIGASASWSVQRGESKDKPGGRWSHVPRDLRLDAREAHRALVRRRSEVPIPLTPPEGGERGCLMCGVGTVLARPSDREAAWGTLMRAHPAAVNGRGAIPFEGYCCPACRAAIGSTGGGVGLAPAGVALLAHLGFRRVGFGTTLREGVARPWAAHGSGATPNATPWAHLDLARIERRLDKAPGVRRGVKP
jgi:hypothetical protein